MNTIRPFTVEVKAEEAENTKNGTSLVLEIRSLNSSKGLDLSVKLPSKYRTLEAEFRNN